MSAFVPAKILKFIIRAGKLKTNCMLNDTRRRTRTCSPCAYSGARPARGARGGNRPLWREGGDRPSHGGGAEASPLEAETGLLGERAATGPLGVGRQPAPAGGQAGSHGGAARNIMWSRYSTPWHDTTSKGSIPSHSGTKRLFMPEIGRRYMESCAILVAQRMSPAADVWARGRQARAPATGVDAIGAAGPFPNRGESGGGICPGCSDSL